MALGVGFSHSCAVRADGGLECWGDDAAYQLGTSATRLRFCSGFEIPCATEPVVAGGGLRWQDVDAGTAFTCGVATNGQAYCQGLNDRGQLGVGGATPLCVIAPYALRLECRETASAIASDAHFIGIATGSTHACALTDRGLVYCWGENEAGELGNGSRTESRIPVAVNVADVFKSIDAGAGHTCGITMDDRLLCWGSNAHGQLGSAGEDALKPRVVLPEIRFRSVATGAHHTCAVSVAGEIWCWGSNSMGQLGIGSDAGMEPTPARVDAPQSFSTVGAGDDHTCGIVETGALYCWGNNSSGQLGDGTRERRTKPTAVALDADVRDVGGGWRHTCALGANGTAWCWGLNTLGMLGRGTSSSTPEPLPAPVAR